MTTLDTPALQPSLADDVRGKLRDAAAPVKLADLTKGLKRPRRVKAADFQEEIGNLLEDEVRQGRAFAYPSGKGGAVRYWARDEKQLLRERALELAATPQPMSKLKTSLGKAVAGADGAFVEAVVRELVGEGRLFEHPAKRKGAAPLLGVAPPPPPPVPTPPLERTKHKKTLAVLAKTCRRLLDATGASLDELFQAVQARMRELDAAKPAEPAPAAPQPAASAEPPAAAPEPPPALPSGVEDLIVKAAETSPVVSIADLRREMPAEYRGPAFDEALLRLADQRRIILYRDADPLRFTEAERAELLQDGGAVFTTISKGS